MFATGDAKAEVTALVEELRGRGVVLAVDGETLRVSAPKGVIDSAMAQQIRERKSEIMKCLRSAVDVSAQTIPVADRSGPLPLGVVQQRMWLHNEMEPDTVLYNLPAAWSLAGPLEGKAFAQAFAAVVERHEVLRIAISQGKDGPVQSVQPAREVALAQEDLSSFAPEARHRELLSRLSALRDRRIDLSLGEPFVAKLFRLAPQEHVFFLMPHHVVWDGWSFDIFLRDLDELYSAHLANRPERLDALPIQYADYAIWHREWIGSDAMQEQVAYWSSVLAGEIPPLELPTDFHRPQVFSHRGDWEEFSLSEATLERVARLAAAHRGTPFMVLLAAWVSFLHRLSGQVDIVVGAPVQARQRPETSDLIGCFVNTICLRHRVDPEASFVQFVDHVRDVCLGAYEHQEAPVDLLVEKLGVRRETSRTPFFQVMFSHQQVSRRPRRLGPLAMSQIHVNPAATPTDLMLAVMEGESGARAVIHYSTDLFSRASIRRLRERFEQWLEASLEDPAMALSRLPIVTPKERALLELWNDTAADYPRESSIQGLFEAQAVRHPARIAIRARDEVLSYAELDERANRVAHALRMRGIGRSHRVGLCVERGPDMVAALFGVLKAGAAYVPLDPAFPAERLRFMAEDAQLSLLVSRGVLAGPFEMAQDRLLLLDADAAVMAALPGAPPLPDRERDSRAEDPAYVIYTSGSTGKPKGVVVPHGAVVNFLTSMARAPGLEKDDVLVAVTTLSFDIAVLELQLPLAVGAAVVIASRDEAADGHALAALLERHKATAMQATPVTWRLLMATGWQPTRPFKALVGGEALPPHLAAQLISRQFEVWNLYGPTETTVWSTCARIADTARDITIGRPIANTKVHVLDSRLATCPLDVPGELCIGGDGVTLGYWNRPELTAERYIADPFSKVPGARLYRTGDRARWRSDGNLEHLGRFDFQVKIRGYRVELGEIEACLATQPGVSQSVVVSREDVPGDVRLVAYVVSREGTFPDAGELRSRLRAVLPDYMIPQHLVPLPAIPVLPNGKIDRSALPPPGVDATPPANAFTRPQTVSERELARIWEEVLHVPVVHREDNFFDLGGHSLLVMQAIFEMERVVGKRVPANRYIFETLGQIARAYDEIVAPTPVVGLKGLFSGIFRGRRQDAGPG